MVIEDYVYDDEDEEDVVVAPKADGRDNPKFNPYKDKEE